MLWLVVFLRFITWRFIVWRIKDIEQTEPVQLFSQRIDIFFVAVFANAYTYNQNRYFCIFEFVYNSDSFSSSLFQAIFLGKFLFDDFQIKMQATRQF